MEKVFFARLFFLIYGLAFSLGNLSAQNSITVSLANSNLGATSIYSLEFDLPDSLTSSGALSVLFPKEFDLSNVNIAASSRIKGGLSTIVKEQEVIIIRKGEGGLKLPGERVDLILSAVKNPSAVGTRSLRLFIHKDGKRILRLMKEKRYVLDNRKSIEGYFSLSGVQ